MLENVHQVLYNSTENSQSDLIWHTTYPHFDQSLFEMIQQQCPDTGFIVVVDAQSLLPPYWLERLVQPMVDNNDVNSVTALTTEAYELSPLAPGSQFKGSMKDLDHAVFLLQKSQLFVTSTINTRAVAVRSQQFLTEPCDTLATTNLIIDQEQPKNIIRGANAIKTGDQRPLPAHPLAELQLKLKSFSINWNVQNYPGLNNQSNVLHVLMDWGGGVQKWVDDFIASHPELNHFILVSQGEFYRKTHGEQFKLFFNSTNNQHISNHHFSRPITATCTSHPEYRKMLNQIIKDWDLNCILVSSLIGHSMDCLNTELPTLRVLHDYFPHWPILNAQLDCDEISDSAIEQALAQSKNEPLGSITESMLTDWQQTNNKLLSRDNVTIAAPNQSVINNLLKLAYSECYQKAQVIPHGSHPLKPINYQPVSEIFKVLVLGRLTKPKGLELVATCIQSLTDDSNIEFVLLGAGKAGNLFESFQHVRVIEDYSQDQLHSLVSEISPQVALLSSTTSETFSYTLSELNMLGIPVLATAVGAFKDRIKHLETGLLVPAHASDICNQLIELKDKPEILTQISQQAKALPLITLEQNAAQYDKVLKGLKLQPSGYLTSGLTTPNPLAQVIQLKQIEHQNLTGHISSLEHNLAEKIKWAKGLNQQISHLEQNLELLNKEQLHLQQVIDQQQQRHKQESDNFKSTIIDLNEKLTDVHELLKQNQTALNQADQVIEEMLNSRSWRFTQPLRTFTTYARHKRNAIKFRFNQLLGLPKRVTNSLKSRGLKETAKIASNKIKKQQIPKSKINVHEVKESYSPLTIATTTDPKVSVIIPVYNQYKHTYHCLESLARLEDKTSFEVIVIDDCSTDDTAQQLLQISGIKAHTQKQNGGFIESCNTGAKLAVGKYLLFLNNDTEVLPGWLDHLMATFDLFPDAGLVGSQLIYPDGRLQEAGGIVFSDASGWNYGRFDQPDMPEYQHLRQVTYCSGASILISTDLFDRLGQFDTRYKPAYYEDTDLAFAVRAAGKKVYYQPLSKVIHFEGITSGTDTSSGTKKYQVINQQKFFEKWQNELQKQPKPNSDIELARFQNQPKRVLILDACTPTPDQDSGSLRMLNLIKIFNDLDCQISFIPENMAHFNNYTENLQQLGVECIYAPKYPSPIEFLKAKGHVFDLIILSRYYVAKPLMPSIRSYCPNAKLWFDTVDLHYLRELRMAELADDESMIKAAKKTKDQELAVAGACDLTLVVSPYEKQVLADEMPDLKVDVLSNIHEVYGNKKSFDQRQDIMFIGGYQHTPNVDGLIWFVDEIFPIICETLPDIKLHIIGSKAPEKIINLGQHPNITFHGFVEDIDPFMENIRLAIAPLRFGAGVKGKVNMSMSHGQPVVGTKVAVEGMYTSHGKDVMMADQPESFAQAVIELYQNKKLWETVSQGGLQNVQKWFSFDAAKSQIKKIL